MRIALLSDIHANLPALRAVLADLDARRDVDAAYHLGDLVGYAPWPNETIALLRERGIPGIAGNYDSTVATHHVHCGCRYEDARQETLSHLSFEWTLANTSAESKRWLASLPFRLDVKPLGGHAAGPTLALVHGTPLNNVTYWTGERSDEFCLKMAKVAGLSAGDAIAFGHTHIAWERRVEGVGFVNTGSVGRPKDGDPRAGYVVVSSEASAWSVEMRRVEYDVAAAAAGIRASELPDEFATFLERGGSGG